MDVPLFLALHSAAPPSPLPPSARSLLWRYQFGLLPSFDSDSLASFDDYAALLSEQRARWDKLRREYLTPPSEGDDAIVHNPLSLDSKNRWTAYYASLDLRASIAQDVARTFPDEDYFRTDEVQERMTEVLFVVSRMNERIGYRQGMHELVAPLILALSLSALPDAVAGASGGAGAAEDEPVDPLAPPTPRESRQETLTRLAPLVCSTTHLTADAFTLFSSLLGPLLPLYDPSPAPGTLAPIIQTSNRIFSLLQTFDPALHTHLAAEQVEPQLFLLRWLRLLFSREFPLEDTLALWDSLFAFAAPDYATALDFVALAVVLRVRTPLLKGEDYSDLVSVVLRYPAPLNANEKGWQTQLFVKQAKFLSENRTPEAGRRVIAQNNALGISEAFVPPVTTVPGPGEQPFGGGRRRIAGAGSGAGEDAYHRAVYGVSGGRQRPQSMALPATSTSAYLLGYVPEGVGELAKGVVGMAAAKADEFRRSILIPPQGRLPNDGMSEIPSRLPWDPSSSGGYPRLTSTSLSPPPLQPTPNSVVPQRQRTAQELARELLQLRRGQKEMGEALAVVVGVLEEVLDAAHVAPKATTAVGEDGADAEAGSTEQCSPAASGDMGEKAIMALATLKHVRDVLSSREPSFNAQVLSPLLRQTPSPAASPVVVPTQAAAGGEPMKQQPSLPPKAEEGLWTANGVTTAASTPSLSIKAKNGIPTAERYQPAWRGLTAQVAQSPELPSLPPPSPLVGQQQQEVAESAAASAPVPIAQSPVRPIVNHRAFAKYESPTTSSPSSSPEQSRTSTTPGASSPWQDVSPKGQKAKVLEEQERLQDPLGVGVPYH